MADQASLPTLLCGPSSPSVHATTWEGEGGRGGVGGGVSLCCVCARRSAYFLGRDVFTMCGFSTLCLGVVFFGRTPTLKRKVEEEEDVEEEELLSSSEAAELPLLLDEARSVEHLVSAEPGFSLPVRTSKIGFRERCTIIVNRLCLIKSYLGLHQQWHFLAHPFLLSSSWPSTTHSFKSTVFGATVGWQSAE